ncbi:hypothetical protein [Kineococcus sp. NPDC059986]|uniref:hypothetical protein n=1 Tax=Kineococcus sp. NPDC059986 TaxID=3155538 RepID=UPI00344CF8D7
MTTTTDEESALDTAAPETPRPAPWRSRRPRWLLALIAAALVLVLAVVVWVQRTTRDDGAPAPAPTPTPQVAQDYPFGSGSVWRTPVTDAPVNRDSAAMVRGLVEQVDAHWGGVAAFNVDQFTASWYTVPAGQPTVDVAWNNCQKKTWTPAGLLGKGGQFTSVPIPADARPSPGSDGQLTVYSPSTDQLWELWRVKKGDTGWSACWGGRIDEVSKSRGYFRDGFGASGSGLAMSAGTVWVDDVRRGRIDHALGLAIVSPATWNRVSWPAQRSDGHNDADHALPEGIRLRLPADLDVSSLGLTPLAEMVARAAQEYGFIVTDQAGAVNVGGQIGQPVADDPDFWQRTMRGVPSYEVLKGFPWDRLEVLPENWGKPRPTASPSAGAGSTSSVSSATP